MAHSTPIITFIGAGNMAQALIGGLINANHPTDCVRVADPSADQRQAVSGQFGIEAHGENARAADGADVIMLAVKPQVMDSVLDSLKHSVRPETLVISVAAGVTLAQMARGLDGHRRSVRAMPNTPALYGAGITGMVADEGVTRDDRERTTQILGTAGKTVWVADESLMDVVTAISGSGPAYFFRFVELLTRAGTRAGLDEADAAALARQTAFGAGTMLAESDLDAAELRRRVTSPGGTTAAALEALDQAGLDEIVDQAVQAAIQRGKELGQ
ncbi:pyrroline-5-carboxylate reductase [Wenzhouxiangella sp. AB-CW3]|uniref:pyrroline-5-carboxylate reductase n=1 Tax=Wenzhouxiangella sp. AB-CW3 TaxID=2771012 RepID=UPI00168BB028|nr:pyrroline-5-carboxylate reductase [Wenzhouxiangella sp. AB-CW3]QOC22420.1 pyrroline-5-carboxylate reductase [Wenzhouxiangella sp. AB-CW3]